MRSLLFILLAPTAFAQSEIFTQFDSNQDDKLTPAELPEQARPLMVLIDGNGDGSLSKAEFEKIAASLRNLTPPQPPATDTGVSNLDYVGNRNSRQTLDLYLPDDKPTERLPLVVYIHGGGWMAGSKQEGKRFAETITSTKEYAAASINYRLTQEALWPAQIHDCKAAIRFLRANADEFGIDPNRIAVMGCSAGGHLASLLGTTNGEKSLEGNLGKFTNQSSEVDAVVNFFGPTDFNTFFGEGVDIAKIGRSSMAVRLLGMTDDEIRTNATLASPVHWITKGDAPFLTAHGTRDQLVPFAQAEQLDTTLKKAGVESHLIAMEGAGHGFAHDELNRRIRTFLDHHLLGLSGKISTEPIRVR